MGKVVVNLTEPLVKEEIENVLKTYPYYPYQEAFKNPEIVVALLAYVLNRIPGIYTVVDEEQKNMVSLADYPISSQRMMDIELWTRRGIFDLVLNQEKDPVYSFRISSLSCYNSSN